jgi:hypothetical protein
VRCIARPRADVRAARGERARAARERLDTPGRPGNLSRMPTRRLNLLLAVLAVPALLASGGCATVVRGSYQVVHASSEPPGATARVGAASCTTPCSLRLPRNRSYVLEVEKPGFEPQSTPIYSQVDALVLGNVCLPPFFIVWGGLDIITGAAWDLSPASVHVPLRPDRPGGGGRAGEGPASPFAPEDEDDALPPGEEKPLPPDEGDERWKAIPEDGTEI